MQLFIEKLGKVAVTVEECYWDINKDYDKLVIVEVKDKFATYISRKAVPANTNITNREYWIPFSSLKENLAIDYNNFKAEYDKKLKSIESKTDTFEEEFNSFKSLNSNVLELLEISRKSLNDSNTAKQNAEQALVKANELFSKIEDYLNDVHFPDLGDSLHLKNNLLEVNYISDEELKSLLIY